MAIVAKRFILDISRSPGYVIVRIRNSFYREFNLNIGKYTTKSRILTNFYVLILWNLIPSVNCVQKQSFLCSLYPQNRNDMKNYKQQWLTINVPPSEVCETTSLAKLLIFKDFPTKNLSGNKLVIETQWRIQNPVKNLR